MTRCLPSAGRWHPGRCFAGPITVPPSRGPASIQRLQIEWLVPWWIRRKRPTLNAMVERAFVIWKGHGNDADIYSTEQVTDAWEFADRESRKRNSILGEGHA